MASQGFAAVAISYFCQASPPCQSLSSTSWSELRASRWERHRYKLQFSVPIEVETGDWWTYCVKLMTRMKQTSSVPMNYAASWKRTSIIPWSRACRRMCFGRTSLVVRIPAMHWHPGGLGCIEVESSTFVEAQCRASPQTLYCCQAAAAQESTPIHPDRDDHHHLRRVRRGRAVLNLGLPRVRKFDRTRHDRRFRCANIVWCYHALKAFKAASIQSGSPAAKYCAASGR